MKTPTHPNRTVRRPFIIAVLLAGYFLAPAAPAQPAATNVNSRLLFIFDTSSNMKRCVPAVQKTLYEILAGTNAPLHPGDSLGVWTFDQTLHAGQYPLQRWAPENAGVIAAGIAAFVGKQPFNKTTKFDAVMPALNRVVEGSERLTVLIFCDGQGQARGTPYDVGINQMLQERRWERQRARQPIVIGLRSQRGQYIGCMVSFPPQTVSLPPFPPLPVPPDLFASSPTSAPPSAPRSNAPPLIIVGTTVTNHLPPPAPKPALATPPPESVVGNMATNIAANAVNVTNPAKPPDELLLIKTSAAPAQPKIAAAATTNAVAPPPERSAAGHKGVLSIGVAFLAGGLAAFLLLRSRRPGGSPGGDSGKKD